MIRQQQRGSLSIHGRSWLFRFYQYRRVKGVIQKQRVNLRVGPSTLSYDQARNLADKLILPANVQGATAAYGDRAAIALAKAKRLSPKSRLTLEQRKQILERQAYRCAVCKTRNPGLHGWHFDHDHETGDQRDALCAGCNLALGHVREDETILMELILYIRRHKGARDAKRNSTQVGQVVAVEVSDERVGKRSQETEGCLQETSAN